MIQIRKVTPIHARGVYAASEGPTIVRCTVEGDEGRFAVDAVTHPMDATWRATWPAELTDGEYTVRAEEWKRVAHDKTELEV